MTKTKITIKTRNGNKITRNVEIIDRIDSDGNQYSIAIVGRAVYQITERHADYNVWGVK